MMLREFVACVMLICAMALAGQSTKPDKADEPDDLGRRPGESALINGVEVYRVGGAVKPPRTDGQPDPFPPYMGFRGSVVFKCIVDSAGKLSSCMAVRTSDPEAIDPAIRALKQWKFKPATKDKQPVAVQINIEINYR